MGKEHFSVWEVIEDNTVRIEGFGKNHSSTGTGFFYSINVNENQATHFLITNKHVVAETEYITLSLKAKKIESGEIINHFKVNIYTDSPNIVPHPNKDIDICAIAISSDFNYYLEKGYEIIFGHINYKQTYQYSLDNGKSKLAPVEEIYMTGYPNGLWDELNNKPLTRKGITATNINYDFNGKKEFVIDMACFGGSSGSPVYIYNTDVFSTEGIINIGSRFILLGILYAGPILSAQGTIHRQNIPIDPNIVSQTQIMMNLGYVIKASELKYLNDMLPDKITDYVL